MNLNNTFYKLKYEKALCVGYFGGSITEGAGASDIEKSSWRALTTEWLKEKFPRCQIKSIQASIGGTGSELGIFRCDRDLLMDKPDLVFIEFAINDNGTEKVKIARSMEGIIRRILKANPFTEIVFVYTITRETALGLDKGEKLYSIEIHQKIANYYRISSINVGEVLWLNTRNGLETWETYLTDGVHPSDKGHAIYAEVVQDFLRNNLLTCDMLTKTVLQKPLDSSFLEISSLADAWEIQQEGWIRSEESMAGRYPHMLESNTPGTELVFKFIGTAIGLYWLIAPDSGDIEWSIDEKQYQKLSSWDHHALLFTRASYHILDEELEHCEHSLKIKITQEKQLESVGNWIRIGAFLVGEKAD